MSNNTGLSNTQREVLGWEFAALTAHHAVLGVSLGTACAACEASWATGGCVIYRSLVALADARIALADAAMAQQVSDGGSAAWWRGHTAGVRGVVGHLRRALDGGDDGTGAFGDAELERVRREVLALRAEVERLRGALEHFISEVANTIDAATDQYRSRSMNLGWLVEVLWDDIKDARAALVTPEQGEEAALRADLARSEQIARERLHAVVQLSQECERLRADLADARSASWGERPSPHVAGSPDDVLEGVNPGTLPDDVLRAPAHETHATPLAWIIKTTGW